MRDKRREFSFSFSYFVHAGVPALVAKGRRENRWKESVWEKTRSDKADVDDTENESSRWGESQALQVTTQLL